MCSSKPKVQAATPAAAPVSAPVETNTTTLDTEGQKRKKKAAGKRGLIVNSTGIGKGTGVNI